jgi:DUF4097 and DUF4098 domain-containing protein YvlB
MPTFQTPQPVALRVRIASGDAHIRASARTDTVVEVLPENPSRKRDVETAEQTRVEQRDGAIIVEAPDDRRGHTGSIRVTVDLPEDSQVSASAASGDIRVGGRVSEVEITTASGDQSVEQCTGNVTLNSASGDISCGPVGGDAKIETASGDVDVQPVQGSASLSTASGDITIPSVGSDARVTSASGDIRVGEIGGSVKANSASGDIALASVRSGKVSAESASGDISIGVASGTAAWLDVHSLTGDISTSLDDAVGPEDADSQVEIRVNTVSGDIRIHRA